MKIKYIVLKIPILILLICILATTPLSNVNITRAAPATTFYVDPASIIDPSKTPGTTITVAVKVTEADYLYSWQFRMNWTTSILSTTAAKVTFGGFLTDQPEGSSTSKRVETALGWMIISEQTKGSYLGKSAAGPATLATITFDVVGTGESDLDINGDLTYFLQCFTVPVLTKVYPTRNNGYFSNAAAADFSLSASPNTISLPRGTSKTSTITVTATGGFSSAVTLTISGLPSGVTHTFVPTSVTPPATTTSTLTLTASASATLGGPVTLTITGTSASPALTHTTTIALTVTEAPSFSLSASPNTLTIQRGSSGTSTITVTATGGFSSAVALSASGLPSGVTAAFVPTSVTPPGTTTSTLTLTASASATLGGPVTVTITGTSTSPALTKTTTISLTVTAAADFSLSASPTTLTIQRGSSGTSTITVTATGGFSSAVALSASGLPSGVTAAFVPTSVTPPGTITSTLTLTASASATLGGPVTVTITGTSTSPALTHTTTISLTVTEAPPTPDFSLSASPNTLTVQRGTSGTSTITVTATGGFSSAVALTISGLPTGVTHTFVPSSVTPPGTTTSTLTLTASASATLGTVTLTVTGTSTSPALTHTTTISLTVSEAPPTPDFSLSASPATLTIQRGSSGTSTITVSATGGFSSAVAFSASGLPSGVTAAFVPTSVTPPDTTTSTLTLSASASATLGGPVTVTITGTSTSPALTHTTTISLTVEEAPPTPDFSLSASPNTLTVQRSSSGTSIITVSATGGFSSAVALSVTAGLPTGVTAAFVPTSVTPPGTTTSTLTLTASASATLGTVTLTITGTSTSPALTHTTTISLTVEEAVATTVAIDPPTSSAEPTEYFTINITITDVTDLYSWGARLSWPSALLEVAYYYVGPTKQYNVTEGPFLQQGGTTSFTKKVYLSYMDLGSTLQGTVPGVTGSGILATIKFKVKDGGNCTLQLSNTQLYNSTIVKISHTSLSGYFYTDKPVAQFKYTPNPMDDYGRPIVGDTVTFNGTMSYDPDEPYDSTPGGIVSYEWDFGDDTTGTGSIATHVYNEPGSYTVTLTVTDDEGKTSIANRPVIGDPAITIQLHDIAVTDVTVTPATFLPGAIVTVNVTVLNKGSDQEYLNVTVYLDSNPVKTVQFGYYYQTDVGWQWRAFLPFEESGTTTIEWNTTGISPGTYTLKVYAFLINPANKEAVLDIEKTEVLPDNWMTYGDVTVLSPTQYDLTISVVGSGTTDPAIGVHTYDEGTEVDVTAIPDSGWTLEHWELDTVNVGSANPYTVTMDSDHTLTAVFTEVPVTQYTLTISVDGPGTTDPAPGDHDYDEGSEVDVTAIPNTGYVFDHWTLDGSAAGSANPYTVTMDDDHTLVAFFIGAPAVEFDLTISVGAGSGTTSPAPGVHTYAEDTEVDVDALPAAGWMLDHWTLDGSNVGSADPYTVTMDDDHALVAFFVEVPAEDVTPPEITITEPVAKDYLHSETITLDFSAVDTESGLESISATLDGEAVESGDTCELFTYSLGEHTLIVTAKDKAGNSATETVEFNIIATVDSLQDLVTMFYESGYFNSPKGMHTSLIQKLHAAEAYIDAGQIYEAIGVLGAFINQLKAQSGKHVSEVAASILITDAQYVRNQLRSTTIYSVFASYFSTIAKSSHSLSVSSATNSSFTVIALLILMCLSRSQLSPRQPKTPPPFS